MDGPAPQVAAATAVTMIAFTSSAASITYARFGFVQPDYAAVLLVLGWMSTSTGHLMFSAIMRALGRRSVIVFVMLGLVGFSAAALFANFVRQLQAAIGAHTLWHLHGICDGAP